MKKICILFVLVFFFNVLAKAQKKSKFQVLNYLNSISGKETISGTHNKEPSATPARWSNKVDSLTGHYPALWSGDFLFQQENIDNRQLMVNEALQQWKKGAVVNIMWHACNPAGQEPCDWKGGVLSKLTDEQWKELTTPGTPLNSTWKQRVDEVCVYLQFLKEHGVEVLWRPMHEMNQAAFWWGGRPGPDGTVKLYRMLHDYMTNVKHLDNLIWVWDVQDFSTLAEDVKVYNPGDQYWNVAALDIYDNKTGYATDKYNIMLSVAHGKPIGIGECAKMPTADDLLKQPKWTFFMVWSELEFSTNSSDDIMAVYDAPNVLTLDKMPGWSE
jgi:mannan endo-1,4-beta-mannosidase